MLKLPTTFHTMQRIPTARSHFKEALSILAGVVDDETYLNSVDHAVALISATLEKGNKIITCGNGGSMCDAMHFAEELSGRYREDRAAYAALALSDAAAMTCISNDFGFENVFSRQVEALGKDHDVLIVISTSGNSANIVNAAEAAKQIGMIVIGLTGNDGGKVSELCDHEVKVPWEGYSDRIQEMHIMSIHAIVSGVEYQMKAAGL